MVLEVQLSLQTANCGLHQWKSNKTVAWLQEWTTHVCHGLASSAQAWEKGTARLLWRALDQVSGHLVSNQPSILSPHLCPFSPELLIIPQLPLVPPVVTTHGPPGQLFKGTNLVMFYPFI